jgi:hypothetical protein
MVEGKNGSKKCGIILYSWNSVELKLSVMNISGESKLAFVVKNEESRA